ncbi:MAG: GTP cyclohydrolase IIa [Candidatus Methylarchaceae archaeon HK01B]|nr:GTP cyclohydrolase IIa [Candidatus Methylarchaceae archaeon HK01M]MCP8312639.1 GTP cyclohydrolase IIa [Candidatus Methylarchaceae archaeon HK02M1]MCP8318573.1 GTP cyclohydrolase IIa [Candidatus Methylarchaceae archaeon HK01B]
MSDKVHMTLIRIDNYGPWTLELGNDREYRLQILQSQLHAHLQRSFAERGGAVFYNRFDEMVAVSNGIPLEDHIKIQEEISKNYPFTISMGIGVGETPYNALEMATRALQKCSKSRGVKKIMPGGLSRLYEYSVQIVHVDVDDMTDRFTYRLPAYDTALMINRLNVKLSELFLNHKALTFFCGGDNFMAVANGVSEREVEEILSMVSKDFDLMLKAGIGVARTGRKAMELATQGLDMIRDRKAKGPVHKLSDILL